MHQKITRTLWLLTILSTSLGLTVNDLCKSDENQCKVGYDTENNIRIECVKQKCPKPYSFECLTAEHICTTNESSCKKFLDFKFKLRSLKSLKSRLSIEKMFELETKKFDLFMKSLRECPVQNYEWQPGDVCKNGQNCRMRQPLPFRFGEISYLQTQIDCPCPRERYPYACGKEYCARDKASCDGLELKKLIYQDEISFDGCNNDDTIIIKD